MEPYGTVISTCQSCHPFDTLGALAWLDDMLWASGVTLRNLPRSQEICWKLQWGTAVGTCLFINIAYIYIYCVAFANERIYNIYCMYVCVCYSIWMCIDVQFMGGILTLVFWDKKMVSQIISLLSNMVWPSSRGNSPMELRIQWMHLERAFNRKWPKHCTGNVEIKTLETNANWIVLHVKIINHNADQRTRWFISGFHRNKSVLNRWNIYINVHILTYKIRSTKETNIWHIILPII